MIAGLMIVLVELGPLWQRGSVCREGVFEWKICTDDTSYILAGPWRAAVSDWTAVLAGGNNNLTFKIATIYHSWIFYTRFGVENLY